VQQPRRSASLRCDAIADLVARGQYQHGRAEARDGIVWSACFAAALAYATERIQFDRPIAATQIGHALTGIQAFR
jgi:hypothetical protein